MLLGAHAHGQAQLWFRLRLPVLWQQQEGVLVLVLANRYSLFIAMQDPQQHRLQRLES